MTPNQRTATVADIDTLIARQAELERFLSDAHGQFYAPAVIAKLNRDLLRLAEAVLVLLTDVDRLDAR